jgi:hypothetical protein
MLTVGERIDEALAELAWIDPQRAARPELARLRYAAVVGTLVSAGRPAEALTLADELQPIPSTDSNLIHDGMLQMLRATAVLDMHGPERALPDATAAFRTCLASGIDRLICYAESELFAIHMAAGRPRTAARWAREVISVATYAQHHRFLASGTGNLATALAMVGDATTARKTLDALGRDQHDQANTAGAQPSWEIQARAWTAASQGRRSDARTLLEAGAEAAADRGQWNVSGTLFHEALRLGNTRLAMHGLKHVFGKCSSPQVALQYRHAQAAVGADIDELSTTSQAWAQRGNHLLAAEALQQAARVARQQRLTHQMERLTAQAAAMSSACQGAMTLNTSI